MESHSTLGSGGHGNALALSWAFGFNKDLVDGVVSLATESRDAVLYTAAHTAIVYDRERRTQRLLQGHSNPITAVAASANKRWLATADAGPDSLLVIWDSLTGTPVKTYFTPHAGGCVALDMTPDGSMVTTLSAPDFTGQEPQVVSLWQWGALGDTAALTSVIEDPDMQKHVRFNPVDVTQLITCGDRRTLFWSWEDSAAGGDGGLRGYAPRANRQGMKQAQGLVSGCCFLPGTTQAISTTDMGEVVLWDSGGQEDMPPAGEAPPPPAAAAHHKRAVKVFSLCDAAIRHVSVMSASTGGAAAAHHADGVATSSGHSEAPSSVTGGQQESQGGGARVRRRTYLVIAGDDGSVRFFDLKFRIQAWFEDFDSGGITSVSFSSHLAATSQGLTLEAPDFVVGTTQGLILGASAGLFEELNPAARCGSVVVQGVPGAVAAIAVHRDQTQLVAACDTGDIMVWDYELKVVTSSRVFDPAKLRPHCLAHHPDGRMMALGFASGALRLVDSATLEDADVLGGACKPASSALVIVRFSPDGCLLAAADADHHVLLWRQEFIKVGAVEDPGAPELDTDSTGNEPAQRESWSYLGRYRSHSAPITGLEFGVLEDGSLTLASTGADRRLVEYNLVGSTPETGVLLVDEPHFVEEAATPTALLWHPLLKGDFEDRIVTANDEYKFKQWNASNKGCRRTSLGPAFGGPVNKLIQVMQCLDGSGEGELAPTEYVAYGTAERVVGLLKLPLDGNPNHSMGLLAHPGEITSMAISGNGSRLFTAGGFDLTINMWRVDTAAMDGGAPGGESEIEPFIELLPGGREGALYQELVDYFYYSQLRTQGEDCTEERDASAHARVPLSEIPFLMRTLGCYPTEQEINNMVSEVKYSEFTRSGEVLTGIDLVGFTRLFVNHRPLFPVGKVMLADAFRALGADDSGGATGGAGKLSWPALCDALMSGAKGGCGAMSEAELKACLEALVGDANFRNAEGLTAVDAHEFACKVLGFEDAGEAPPADAY